MDTGTLIKVVAMIDARINQIYYGVMPELADNPDTLPWEYENAAGALSELMDLSERLQNAIDADVSAMETGMGM
jgi:hypothetical protein